MSNEPLPAQLDVILGRLDQVRRSGAVWVARCPCPEHGRRGDGDRNPSLAIGLGHDGRVLVHCRVGCTIDAVLDAIGLDYPDLYPGDGSTVPGDPPGGAAPIRPAPPNPELAAAAYAALLGALTLADDHRRDLNRRGLIDEQIDRRDYRSLRNVDKARAARAVAGAIGDRIVEVPGFARGHYGLTLAGTAAGLLVPVRGLDGAVRALKVRQATEPRYLYLSGQPGPSCGSPVHVPLGVAGPAEVVRVTEGELKSDVCTGLDPDLPTVGVPGVAAWAEALPILHALGARTVVLAFDAPDVWTNPVVFRQVEACCAAFRAEGFEIELEDWYEPDTQGDR